jgi:hypothetical protein
LPLKWTLRPSKTNSPLLGESGLNRCLFRSPDLVPYHLKAALFKKAIFSW